MVVAKVVVAMCDLQRYRNTEAHIIVRQTIIFDTGERARRKYSALNSGDLILTSISHSLSRL